jgi:hypothetical protein
MADHSLFLTAIISLTILCSYLVIVFRGNVRFLPRHAFLGKHLGEMDGGRLHVFMGGVSLLWASVSVIGFMPYVTSIESSGRRAI